MSTGLECRLRWAVRIWVRTASASRAQCNRAVFREAVGSFVHALQRRLLLHQPRISTETFDDEYKYSLPKRGSLFKGSGVAFCLVLQVLGSEPCMFGDSCEHARTDFFRVMKGKGVVIPTLPDQRSMRTALTLDFPSELQERGEDDPCRF